MSQELYSVEQVAERLGLHVKTVRAYVRDGRLKATRIGKQYRIAREDLETFTGQSAAPGTAVRRTRHVEVSTVVHVDAASKDLAYRLNTALTSAVNGRAHSRPVRIECVYDEERARLKIIISADADTTAALLGMVSLITGDGT
jgi:excisionase family DNA binding protein